MLTPFNPSDLPMVYEELTDLIEIVKTLPSYRNGEWAASVAAKVWDGVASHWG